MKQNFKLSVFLGIADTLNFCIAAARGDKSDATHG